jgi:hypothetical protein
MDPQDHLRALPDGVTCTVCEDRVPVECIRLLAWREDLAFLQIDCPACRSTTLGFVMPDGDSSDVIPPPGQAVSSDDVLDMHQFLAAWKGDLASLLAGARDLRQGAARPGPRDSDRGADRRR